MKMSSFFRVFFLILFFSRLLLALDAFPPLVKEGEKLEFKRDSYYIDNKTSFKSVAVIKDGKAVSGSSDGTIKIWDIRSGKLLKTLTGHKYSVSSVAVTKDNKVVSGSADGTIKIWDIKNEEVKKELVEGDSGSWVIFDYEKHKIFRSDRGDMLYVKRDNSLYPLLPQTLTKKDDLKVTAIKKEIVLDGNNTVELNITNLSNSDAFWIKGEYFKDGIVIRAKVLEVVEAKKDKVFTLPIEGYLDRVNPKPIKQKIKLKLKTANSSEFFVNISVVIPSADISVEKAILSEDKKTLKVTLRNSGDRALKNAKVKLLEPFESNIQELSSLEANKTVSLAFILPKDLDKKSLKIKVFVPNDPSLSQLPLYEWQRDGIKIVLPKPSIWSYILLLVLITLLIGLIFWYKRYKNPIVVKLLSNEKELYNFDILELEEVKKRLSKIDRFSSLLKSLKIEEKRFEKAVEFSKKADASYLAKLLEVDSFSKDGEFYKVGWRDGNFELNMDNFLLLVCEKSFDEIKGVLKKRDDEKVFVINLKEQDSIAEFAKDRVNRVIAPTSKELTKLLLSPNPKQVFIQILSKCLSFKYLSPYQDKGGVKNESNFFGRVEILREVISKESENYIIVGARQLGKSSILEALKRRYEQNSEVECFYITLNEDGSILRDISYELGLEVNSSLDDVVEAIKRVGKRVIFLIDEADIFVENDKKDGYKITSNFRKLSQEGYAKFVIAGFWKLYEQVGVNYMSPLKNFGKVIELGGLDSNSSKKLMIEPMKKIGVSYESEKIVEELIKRCGYRANLIASICDKVVRDLETKVIKQEDIDKVIESGELDSLLYDWQGLTLDDKKSRIDRVVVYLTYTKESFRLSDVAKDFEKYGLKIDNNQIQESLKRLVLGYVIKKRKGDYFYTIPLLKEILLDDDIEFLLESDVKMLSL